MLATRPMFFRVSIFFTFSTVFTLLAIAPTTLAAENKENRIGTEGSGGLPPYIAPPAEQFQYNCSITLAEQTTDSRSDRTCYSEGTREVQFTNSDLDTQHLAPFVYFESGKSGWVTGHSWDNCPKLPTHLEGHVIEISFGPTRNGQEKMASLFVKVQRNEHGDRLFAEADSAAFFHSKKITADASFSHKGVSPSLEKEDIILDLNVTCQRLK